MKDSTFIEQKAADEVLHQRPDFRGRRQAFFASLLPMLFCRAKFMHAVGAACPDTGLIAVNFRDFR